ncbi:hypothetical protein LTR10_018312 [Elasticomyces elasticus]|uniref:BRCT domain-containing protein n=1 Tax=Exophiala sideris TaxID=1016849 RepID=A0ABR0JMA7_9EURO|nr:hypothetical protein LTR10_018312 [Elasticomyces elasticus]KAK5024219.1 hypothetical protein LTR13_011002 [Exophiala sideris]KAK5036702.1 hypothetical protein LTS07_002430 [Exophiala sideris]KAK5067086.1 hypothetical protein LTR69_002435 [Exophiala sideris]KAK5186740.1 hypothetical protein LTR44_000746 [Eurotiomycetes sp. CCFEE 6388]
MGDDRDLGHQRAENRLSGSTSWRDSRAYKLRHQFRDSTGGGGDNHLSDLVGAGSEGFGKDGRKENGDWEKGAPGLRENGWQDIRSLMDGNRKRSAGSVEGENGRDSATELKKRRTLHDRDLEEASPGPNHPDPRLACTQRQPRSTHDEERPEPVAQPPQIFRNLNIYLNGSTAPLISDHRLKQLFAQHGGNTSIGLGRRTVTHVIIGDDCGGGLASTKIQKEVALVGGKGVKYVTAQWILDSIEKGIRQPEARYVPKNLDGRIGGSGQASVRTMFQPKKTK